jgi:hypothetical protein
MRIKIHKHKFAMGTAFCKFGEQIRDLGDYTILLWKFEIKIWLKKPYYNHLPIIDNGAEL